LIVLELPPSRSEFLRARGLRHHVRCWPADARDDDPRPPVFLLHGWGDVSATFAPLAAPLLERYRVLAPDLRGFGLSQWPADGYWFPDYVADFEVLADHYCPRAPIRLIGHSMGAQIASLYAGLRPARVHKLVLLDGLGLPDMPPQQAPARFRRWLDQLRDLPQQKCYASFAELAARIRRRHPGLAPEVAEFVARCWGREDQCGRIALCADPRHRLNMPGLYRAAEAEAIWKEVTAPTLFIDGGCSEFLARVAAQRAQARRCFRERREVVIAHAGHMLHFDAPEQTARAITEFLAD
jgi:pimeloyl-ACP methyl ester carboxylesterase